MTIYGWSEELVSRCVECNLAEPESLASLGGPVPGLVDGILSSDMGKTIVRQHLDNMNAQWVWEEFATHMTTSSKGQG